MERLLERADQLDGLVVETSGLALPEPLVAAFQWPQVRTRTRVHAVVTVVDGEALSAGHMVGDEAAVESQRQADPSLEHLSALEELFDEQLEVADLVAVSRADIVPADALEAVIQAVRAKVRPGIPVLPMVRGGLPADLLLGRALGDPGQQGLGTAEEGETEDHDHAHVAMDSIVIRRWGSIGRTQVEQTLLEMLGQQPILRLKGRVQESGKRLTLQIQAVGPRLECWYEGVASSDPQTPTLELVALVPAAQRAQVVAAAEQLWPALGPLR
jgi:cobalamin biosynthesis protein CobW